MLFFHKVGPNLSINILAYEIVRVLQRLVKHSMVTGRKIESNLSNEKKNEPNCIEIVGIFFQWLFSFKRNGRQILIWTAIKHQEKFSYVTEKLREEPWSLLSRSSSDFLRWSFPTKRKEEKNKRHWLFNKKTLCLQTQLQSFLQNFVISILKSAGVLLQCLFNKGIFGCWEVESKISERIFSLSLSVFVLVESIKIKQSRRRNASERERKREKLRNKETWKKLLR